MNDYAIDENVLTDVLTYMAKTTNSPIFDGNSLTTIANGGITSNTISTSTITKKSKKDLVTDLLDEHHFNQVIIDHKVSEQELMKLKETSPTYADEIKEKIAREIAREVSKKVAYTKKTIDDTHHYMGRVWLFTTEELTELIEKVNNV